MFGKSAEDKAAEKQAKQEAKDKATMEKFGLNFDSYTEADIQSRNINSSKEIAGSLAGSADVSKMDDKSVLALLVWAARAERYLTASWLDLFKSGAVKKWLLRLKGIDN